MDFNLPLSEDESEPIYGRSFDHPINEPLATYFNNVINAIQWYQSMLIQQGLPRSSEMDELLFLLQHTLQIVEVNDNSLMNRVFQPIGVQINNAQILQINDAQVLQLNISQFLQVVWTEVYNRLHNYFEAIALETNDVPRWQEALLTEFSNGYQEIQALLTNVNDNANYLEDLRQSNAEYTTPLNSTDDLRAYPRNSMQEQDQSMADAFNINELNARFQEYQQSLLQLNCFLYGNVNAAFSD